MKKIIFIIFLLSFLSNAFPHNEHYKGIIKIEMDVMRNGEVIGYSNYYFEHKNDEMIVKNYTKFKVDLFGVEVFKILSEGTEKYNKNNLVYFKSTTFQNDKEKYVNLKFDETKRKFIINGSSFQGEAEMDCIIGNWWNHKILQTNKQISPLSGSVKEQIVTFVGKEVVNINDKNYHAEHYKLKSKDENLPKDKKLDFDIWYDPKKNLILKVSYSRMGDWEYKLRNFE